MSTNLQCLACWEPLVIADPARVVCPSCNRVQPHLSQDLGEYFDCRRCGVPLDPPSDEGRVWVTCTSCGERRRFVRGPMVVISGSPGVGKSVLGVELVPVLERGVVLEWGALIPSRPDSLTVLTGFKDCLKVAIQVAQGGRYLVLPDFARPREFDSLPERRWLGTIHWLVLVCEPGELARRLRTRRKSAGVSVEEVEALRGINEEMRQIGEADPRVTMLDTTHMTREAVVRAAARMITNWTEA